jgi:hypothetical protein
MSVPYGLSHSRELSSACTIWKTKKKNGGLILPYPYLPWSWLNQHTLHTPKLCTEQKYFRKFQNWNRRAPNAPHPTALYHIAAPYTTPTSLPPKLLDLSSEPKRLEPDPRCTVAIDRVHAGGLPVPNKSLNSYCFSSDGTGDLNLTSSVVQCRAVQPSPARLANRKAASDTTTTPQQNPSIGS